MNEEVPEVRYALIEYLKTCPMETFAVITLDGGEASKKFMVLESGGMLAFASFGDTPGQALDSHLERRTQAIAEAQEKQ